VVVTNYPGFEERSESPVPDGFVGLIRSARTRPAALYVLPAMLVGLLILSGCASLSAEECLAADWYTIGVEDGSRGQSVSRIGAHRKACAEVGVQPDMARYDAGRAFGLQSFCTRERGYAEGENGRSYSGVCPPHLEPVFMQGYLAGQDRYRIKQDIRRLERELAAVNEEVAEIRGNLDQGYTVDEKGKKHNLNKYERDAMYERLLALGKEEGRLEGEISALRNGLSGA
jgi:hypothetical protein